MLAEPIQTARGRLGDADRQNAFDPKGELAGPRKRQDNVGSYRIIETLCLSVRKILDRVFDYSNGKHRQPCENPNYKQQPQANRIPVTGPKDNIELERDISESSNNQGDYQKL